MKRLASGASRVIAAIVESGCPGRRACAMASLNRSMAARNAPVTSPAVRDTSVAVSTARAAMPGCGGGSGFSIFTGVSLNLGAYPARSPEKEL